MNKTWCVLVMDIQVLLSSSAPFPLASDKHSSHEAASLPTHSRSDEMHLLLRLVAGIASPFSSKGLRGTSASSRSLRENDVVCYNHGDAPEHHAFHQPGTPRSPPQRAQAEDGTLHVLVIEISCTALLMTLGDLKGNGKPFGVRSQQECPHRNNGDEAQAGIEGEK
nr:Os01g0926450 [Ipomoea batatas]